MKLIVRKREGFTLKNLSVNFSGFTLIEVIIVVGITALVSTVGLSLYRDYSRRQTVVQEGEQLRTILVRTRQRAISGERPDGCSGELTGYSFICANGGTSYQVKASCRSLVQVDGGNLPDQVSFSACSPVFFKVLGQGTNLSVDQTMTLSGFKGTYVGSLVVQTTGVVK